MTHLTNFFFEFFYETFTEDASLLFLYHGAKKSKMTKNSNQGGDPAITIGLEIGLLTKITFWSLLKVPFKTDLLVKTV